MLLLQRLFHHLPHLLLRLHIFPPRPSTKVEMLLLLKPILLLLLLLWGGGWTPRHPRHWRMWSFIPIPISVPVPILVPVPIVPVRTPACVRMSI